MTTVAELLGPDPEDAEVATIDPGQIGSAVISAIEIHYRDWQLYAEALVSCGFDEHFTEMVGIDMDDLDEWANKRARKIEMWFATRYGCVVENESWRDLMARFTILVPSDMPVDEVAEWVENKTQAIRLFNESDPGTYGADDLWRRLADYLSRS